MSSSGNYDVWILASRMSHEDATFALARVFGVPREHAEQIVRRAPCRVKKRVDRETAERMTAVLESAGFVAELRPDSPSSRPPPGAAPLQSLPPPGMRPPAALELAPAPRHVSERARALAASVSSAPPPMQQRERPDKNSAPPPRLSKAPSVRPPRVNERPVVQDVSRRRRSFAWGIAMSTLGAGVLALAAVYGHSVLFGNLPIWWIWPEALAAAFVLMGVTRAFRGASIAPATIEVQPFAALVVGLIAALISNYFGPLSQLRPLHIRQAEIDADATLMLGTTCVSGHTFIADQRSSLGSLEPMRARTLLHALDGAGARRVCVVAGQGEDGVGIRHAERLVVVLGSRHTERVPAAAERMLGSADGRLGQRYYILELP